MDALESGDMEYVVRRLPTDIRSLLKEYEGRLYVAGGYIRAVIAGEEPSDIDLFGADKDILAEAATRLAEKRGENTRVHKTKNAITVISVGRITIQFITRWTFVQPQECAASFDFTICQSVIWRHLGKYQSLCAPSFYKDLAARRLVYTHPVRHEEAGGSLMRVLKYTRRGYTIQVKSLAGVVSRLIDKVDFARAESETRRTFVLAGLLREVDPSLVVDGLDVHDDHETPIEGVDEENGEAA
ncbi:MAG: hypothetical protein ACRC14_02595 [Paracoccaceae bacterium]